MSTQPIIIQIAKDTLQNAASFRIFGETLLSNKDQPIIIVGTEIAGSTTLLEGIIDDHQQGDLERAMAKLNTLRTKHYDLAYELFGKEHPVFDELNDHFVTIEWDLEEPKHENIDYAYDQAVAIGELLATLMMASYLEQQGLKNHLLDARDIIFADDNFRNGNVLKKESEERMEKYLKPILVPGSIVLTQASLACTTENYSIILGRENGVNRSILALKTYLDC